MKIPEVKQGAHIGLLGGSFDPPHLGHSLLALSFLAIEPIDELWIIPCQNHAFKGEISRFEHRFNMCELAFSRIKQVRVLDIESQIPPPNYTIKTLEYLSARPDLKFYFAIGSDLVEGFHRWHRAEEVAQKASIVIFERQNYPLSDLPPMLKHARVHHGYRLPDTNSTELRASFKNQSLDQAFIDQKVRDYIEKFELYRS